VRTRGAYSALGVRPGLGEMDGAIRIRRAAYDEIKQLVYQLHGRRRYGGLVKVTGERVWELSDCNIHNNRFSDCPLSMAHFTLDCSSWFYPESSRRACLSVLPNRIFDVS
jgi:hypothetical protein